MMREVEATGKTVDEAYAAGCAELGVSTDDLNVSYEVIDFPVKKLFKTLPARVKVVLEQPDAAEEPQERSVASASQPAAPTAAETASAKPTEGEAEEPIDLAQNAKVNAAVEYLKEVSSQMGVVGAEFSAVQKGEATIIRVEGDNLGVMIGRRGETMESLSYLASLVANRMEGDYIKLGLDVAGYRGKREQDLAALAQRLGEKVRRTGRAFAMEPMNPYERRIIHSAVSAMEGLRSESKGEGKDRRVIIYSTAPDASTEEPETEHHSHGGQGRGFRGGRPGARGQGHFRGNSYGHGTPRSGSSRGPRPSSVPERTYETRTVDDAAPVAPKRTERVDDFSDFGFGKIDL